MSATQAGVGAVSGGFAQYRRGSTIFFQGDAPTYWFEVDSGIVRTCRLHADGHRQLTSFFFAGDVFGLDDHEYCESAEAVTDARLRRYPRSGGPVPSPGTSVALRRALASARACIHLLGHRTAAERIAAFMLALVERNRQADGVELPMSRGDIADHLGLTIHTVSRTLGDFCKSGLIALEGRRRLRILDIEALSRIADSEWTAPPTSRPEAPALSRVGA